MEAFSVLDHLRSALDVKTSQRIVLGMPSPWDDVIRREDSEWTTIRSHLIVTHVRTVAMHHVRKGAGRKIHACANVVERSYIYS